jgi:hypothetical protein
MSSAVLRKFMDTASEQDAREVLLCFQCPGCNRRHGYRIKGTGPVWDWNGSMDRPTFSPSLLVTYPALEGIPQRTCHLFLTDGKIQFLSDCHHALAGQTFQLPAVESQE